MKNNWVLLLVILVHGTALKLRMVSKDKEKTENTSRFKMDILMRGWIKIVVTHSQTQEVQAMEVNPLYQSHQTHSQDRDEYGPIDIPDQEHFFMLLTAKDLYILQGRRNDMIRTYKTMSVDSLLPLRFQNGSYSGGLEDMGAFSEGYCFKLENDQQSTWNVCTDMLEDKVKWLQQIQKLIKKERVEVNSKDQQVLNMAMDMPIQVGWTMEQKREQKSYWRIVQSWSECSRICGGGYQYLQRECVGNQCGGDAILKRECNQQACPPLEVKSHETRLEQIQVVQNRTRLQRYQKCNYKQDDMDIRLSLVGSTPIDYRVWVVINNHTLSIYMDGADFNTIYRTYNLQDMKAELSQKEDKCIVIKETNRNDTLCIVDQNVRESVKSSRDQYMAQLMDFKNNCGPPVILKKTALQMAEESMLKSEEQKDCAENDRLNQMQQEIDKEEKQYDGKMKEQLVQVNKFVKMQVAMIKEEQERERKQAQVLEDNMQLEKEKGQGLERELLRKERVEDLRLEQKSNQQKMEQLTKLQQTDMQAQLDNLKAKIKQMRMISDRKLKIKKQEILDLRTKITSKLLKQDNNRDISVCCPARPQGEQKEYCDKEILFNEAARKECKESAELFCYNCCENQVGRMYMQKRDACYSQCVE